METVSEEMTSNSNKKTSSNDEYMKQLRQWSKERSNYYWMWHQYLTMQTHALHMHMIKQISSSTPPIPSTNLQANQPPTPNVPQNREYVIPSLMRRFLAETADFIFLLVIKTVGLVYVLNMLGLNLNSNDVLGTKLIHLLQEDITAENWETKFLSYFTDEDLEVMEDQLSTLLSVTIFYRFLTGIYEWLFIWLLGFTPGKLLFGLKIVSCITVTHNRPDTVTVTPGSRVTCAGALFRSLMKNVMISFMIPAFLTIFFNPYKRSTYDELSQTIVVRRQTLARNR